MLPPRSTSSTCAGCWASPPRTKPTPPATPTPSRRAPEKTSGGDGFADVWKRGHFAWEYKGKRKNLDAAYSQLLQYREALDNPPLLVVCDLDRFEVHTNFTNTPVVVHKFTLADLLDRPQGAAADPPRPHGAPRGAAARQDQRRDHGRGCPPVCVFG